MIKEDKQYTWIEDGYPRIGIRAWESHDEELAPTGGWSAVASGLYWSRLAMPLGWGHTADDAVKQVAESLDDMVKRGIMPTIEFLNQEAAHV